MDKDILFNQVKTYRKETLEITHDVTEVEANIIPNGFHNNIRWNLGHIYLDQYLWIQAVTREKKEGLDHFNKWFGFGTSPADFTNSTPTMSELKQLLVEQPNDILARYSHRLNEPFEPTEMGIYTIEQVLIRTIYHEGLHAATIKTLKRFI
ncbi:MULTISPECIES: DinB family protein [unclassified Virgibacillus]|uniref:DinB family protein n=1 Tax=unclassified Virgibacillus TaxID=2620237 RepID=UPI0024DE4C24|nr:DinB family protein [Virgibacillus sp. LDC-1]